MIRILAAAAAVCLAAPIVAQNVPPEGAPSIADAAPLAALNLEQQSAVRCSAAFAVVAQGQAGQQPFAAEYPPLGARGREFMVRSMARLMDEESLDRVAISRLLSAQVQTLWSDKDLLARTLPPCLALLDASGV